MGLKEMTPNYCASTAATATATPTAGAAAATGGGGGAAAAGATGHERPQQLLAASPSMSFTEFLEQALQLRRGEVAHGQARRPRGAEDSGNMPCIQTAVIMLRRAICAPAKCRRERVCAGGQAGQCVGWRRRRQQQWHEAVWCHRLSGAAVGAGGLRRCRGQRWRRRRQQFLTTGGDAAASTACHRVQGEVRCGVGATAVS